VDIGCELLLHCGRLYALGRPALITNTFEEASNPWVLTCFDPQSPARKAVQPLNPFDVSGSDDAGPFVDVSHDTSFELIAAGRPRVVAMPSEPLDCRGFRQNIGYHAVQAIRD